MKIKFHRFTRPAVLKRIGRNLLVRFLEAFQPAFQSSGLALPPPGLEEDAWFGAVARLLSAPASLPDGLNEALLAIEQMATAEGQEQLERAVAQAGLKVALDPDSSREDLALQVWLAAPELLARKHNEQRLRRLTAFEYFRSPVPAEGRPVFTEPDRAAVVALAANLDPWFARHQRGRNTTRLEVYPMNGEFWFLVRHGDTFTRAPKVEEQRTEILHFRPERDDVIVYSPARDEIRINARTRGERELYVRAFGLCLRGSEDWFCERRTYTLEPLRADGSAALDPEGVPGLCRVTLRELQVAWDNGVREVITREADDLFQCGPAGVGRGAPIPEGGRLARAGFDFHFTGASRPRPVQVRPPIS